MIALLIGSLIGLVLGLTGAGGSILALPLLMTLLHLPMTTASGLSLGAVGLAAWLGVLLRWRSGQIQWFLVAVMAGAGALLTPAGQWLGRQFPEPALLTAFAVLAAAISVRMWRQARQHPEDTRLLRASPELAEAEGGPVCRLTGRPLYLQSPCVLRLLLAGALAGLLSGLFGVGGGFVIVPMLVLLTNLPMRMAVATSLGVIGIVSLVGFGNFLRLQSLPLPLLLSLVGGAVLGMAAGSVVARRVAGPMLQQGFAVMVALLAIQTLWRAWS